MVASSQKLVISGYYGFKNSGDEAVLQSILTALEEKGREAGVSIEPVVLSIDPEWTSSTYGVKSVHRMKLGEVRQALKDSIGLISGGGSLLQDATSSKTIPYYLGIIKLAQWMRKPVFIYSQGIGPVNNKFFHPLIKSVFRKCEYISVRDVQSAELLQQIGLAAGSVNVVPDPVMGLTTGSQSLARLNAEAEHLPMIGISVRFWDKDKAELTALAHGLRQICQQQPLHLRFLPFHLPDDEEASRFVIDQLGDMASNGSAISVCSDATHPQHMLAEVGRCQLVIGMRLHSLIYAANQLIPMIGISYDPKIDHFLSRLDILPVGTSASLQPENVSAEMARILSDPAKWREDHAGPIEQLRREAQAPARHIIDYVSSQRVR